MKILPSFAITSLAFLTCCMPLTAVPGNESQKTPELDQEVRDAAFWKSVYEENHVVEIDISLTSEAWKAMQPAQDLRGRGGPRGGGRPEGPPPGGAPGGPGGGRPAESNYEYAKATITVDGELLEDSGLRFKGNSSYRASADGFKRPLKIDTNRFTKGQKLHGQTKLNLSNSHLDPAFMKEKLAYEIYQAAGLPTPGTGWAKVKLSIEGELEKKSLGLYVLVEQVDEGYLARHFGEKTRESLLMKPEGPADWQNPGEDTQLFQETFGVKEGEDNKDQMSQFSDLLTLIKDAPDARFAREIGAKLDLDLLAGYLAATSLLASLDSYASAPHNYYLLVDKADQKTRLLPWDVNEAFGTFSMGTTPESLIHWDINRPWVSNLPLLDRLFATKEFPKLYKQKLRALMDDTFTEKNLFSRIATFQKALTPHLGKEELASFHLGIEGDDSGLSPSTFRSVPAIKPFVKKRIKSVKAQLTGKSQGVKIEGGRGRSPGGRPGGRPGDRPAPPNGRPRPGGR